MLVINDLHLGVVRSGGTTPSSQADLRNYLINSLESLLADDMSLRVVVNGDLFDSFQVDTATVIAAHKIFSKFIAAGGVVTLIMGNHDASAKGDRVSSFHLLAHILQATNEGYVDVIDHTNGFTHVDENVYAISHCLNQSLFDLELDKAVEFDGTEKYLLLHCNYKNGFAENSDHSLNINDKQVGDLMRSGWTLVLGHEHQGYTLRSCRVIVLGNQFPSSAADCIGDDQKHALIINGNHTFVPTWSSAGSYIEPDWRELDVAEYFDFVRVVGNATAEESASVIKAISQLRQRSYAYVITNAVKVEGHDMAMSTESVENIKAFDVMAAIFAELNEREIETVKELTK